MPEASEMINKVKDLPRNPGIYKFYNTKDKIIYIGKAKNLRSRVGSYFRNNLDKKTKTYKLVSEIKDFKIIEVQSELEALILEAALIKKHKPKYNIALKDDKSYIYIVIVPEKVDLDGRKLVVPKIITARKADLAKGDIFFGPYPSTSTTKYIMRTLRKSLPFRDCSVSKFNRYVKLQKPCLYGHLGLCQCPCAGVSIIEYRKGIMRIKKLLKGNSMRLIESLEKEMKLASKNRDYEKAAHVRDLINKFHYIRQGFRMPSEYMENPYLVEDLRARALDSLVEHISILRNVPYRIECYDISNISGKEAVGAMVVALSGKITKSEYRKFKIKFKSKPDDVGMMQEVLRRRLKREIKSSQRKSWGFPDLIVLDGGKAQVSAILDVLHEVKLSVPVIGLAKRFEIVVYHSGNNDFVELNFRKDDEGLKLLIRLRNEAHRFAQRYHHQLRLKALK